MVLVLPSSTAGDAIRYGARRASAGTRARYRRVGTRYQKSFPRYPRSNTRYCAPFRTISERGKVPNDNHDIGGAGPVSTRGLSTPPPAAGSWQERHHHSQHFVGVVTAAAGENPLLLCGLLLHSLWSIPLGLNAGRNMSTAPAIVLGMSTLLVTLLVCWFLGYIGVTEVCGVRHFESCLAFLIRLNV